MVNIDYSIVRDQSMLSHTKGYSFVFDVLYIIKKTFRRNAIRILRICVGF